MNNNMKNKIMILGAGIYQVPLIKCAKNMGIYTIVVSIDGKYPGFKYADKIYKEDTRDYNKVLEIARNEKISGIITAGTDVAVTSVGKVCDELGLKGISYESAKISNDKLLMKDCFEKYGVNTAKYRKCSFDYNDVINKISDLKFPLIFKAVDSSGSRGIIVVRKSDEILSAIEYVKNATQKDYYIVEEFLDGKEFGAQAFVQNGKLEFMMLHGDYVFNENTGVPVGHWVPYEVNPSIENDAYKQIELAIKAMKLDNCAMNVDFLMKDDKVYVLEIGGRSGATCLSELVSLHYGFNYYEKMINIAMGIETKFNCINGNYAIGELLKSDKTGTITNIRDDNKKTQDGKYENKNISEIQIDYNVGDKVEKFCIGPHRIGHVIVTGKNQQDTEKNINEVMSNIKVEVNE